MSESDLKDLVELLERLRLAIDLTSPIFLRRSTGIEINQSVQYYHSSSHLTDSNDRAPDNSATLVAYKPAVVRAYVRPAFGLPSDAPVGGTLKLERKSGIIGPWREVRMLSPWQTPTMTPLDDTYADERGTFLNSLNFRIDASDLAGNMRLTLQLDTGETRTTNTSAYLVQALRVRVILVSYQGPSTANPTPGTTPPTLTLAAPTLADAQMTATTAFRMMPVQQTGSFAVAGTLTWDRPLDDALGTQGCTANWDALLTKLDDIRKHDGNRADVVYYGLLPTGIPVGAVVGCGRDGLGAAASGNSRTFVHEIGHAYGFDHSPSGNVSNVDPYYPVYEPYPSASIGEYGCDIQNGAVYSPNIFMDYMSYAPNRWMSLYQHGRLLNHPRLAPYYIKERNPLDDIPVIIIDRRPWWWPDPPGPDPPPWEREDFGRYRLDPVISIRGIIDELGRVRVDSVARIKAARIQQRSETGWNAVLMGSAGEVVSRARLTRVISHGGGCGCGCSGSGSGKDDPNQLPLEFAALLPDTELGASLQILDRGGKEAWTRSAPDESVCFANVAAKLIDETTLRLDWDLDAGKASDVSAQYSSDEGKTWHGLTVGLRDGSAEVDAQGLPAGVALVRLLAHDGFSTVTSDPVKIRVLERAPYPAILYPEDGEVVAANAEFEVLGSAVDQGGIPIDDKLLEWLVDGQPVKSRGRAVKVLVKEGSHKLTLRAIAKHNAEITVVFTARDIRRSAEGSV